jgi:hypothetical protein
MSQFSSLFQTEIPIVLSQRLLLPGSALIAPTAFSGEAGFCLPPRKFSRSGGARHQHSDQFSDQSDQSSLIEARRPKTLVGRPAKGRLRKALVGPRLFGNSHTLLPYHGACGFNGLAGL